MKNSLIYVFALFTLNSFAQYEYPSVDDAKIVLESTLAVQLLDEESDWIHMQMMR